MQILQAVVTRFGICQSNLGLFSLHMKKKNNKKQTRTKHEDDKSIDTYV